MAQPRGRCGLVVLGAALLAVHGSARAEAPPLGGDQDATTVPPSEGPGLGEGAEEATAAPGDADRIDAPPPQRESWAADHLWQRTGLSLELVAGASDGEGGVYALGVDGSVWRWRPGRGWREILAGYEAAPDLDDEALLLEAESTVDELLDTDDLAEQEVDDAGDALPGTVELSGEAADIALIDVDARRAADRSDPRTGLVWVPADDPRSVYVGRADGLWYSRDMGRRWTRLADIRGASAMLARGGSLLLGATDGLWVAEGDRGFRRLVPGLGARAVHALVADGDVVLAGTADGLWRRDAEGFWQPAGGVGRVEVFDVLVDPDWDGGLWLATSVGLLRSDDGGESARPASRNPLLGVRRLVPLDGPGHLLAAGDDGVWESTDGGTTWAPLAQGLDEAAVRALLRSDGRVLLLGRAGAYLLARAPTPVVEEDSGAALPLPALEEVVAHALERPGLSMDQLSLARRVVLARFAPKLDLLGRYQTRFNRDSDYISEVTREEAGPYWIAEARLCWGLCDDTVDVFIDYDDLSSFSDATDLTDLGVVAGEVYDFSTDTAVPVAAANVASKAISYRTAIADIVTRAWFRRRALAVQAPVIDTLPLEQQLAWQLDVAEVDARLDLYTDGWYAGALDASD